MSEIHNFKASGIKSTDSITWLVRLGFHYLNELELNNELTANNLKNKRSPVIDKAMRCLALVGLHDLKRATNQELSRHLNINRTHTSKIIHELMEFGYVEVSKNPSDGRFKEFSLNRLGLAQVQLIELSWQILPGRDKLAEAIIQMGKKIKRIASKGEETEEWDELD